MIELDTKPNPNGKMYKGKGFLLSWLQGDWEHDLGDVDVTTVQGDKVLFAMANSMIVEAKAESELEWDADQKQHYRVLK